MDDRLFYSGIALLSSCAWALGAILWRKLGEHLSSYGMNLAKTVLGTLFLGIFVLIAGAEPVDTRSLLFLALSGVIGIAVGDTFFFRSLMELGPRRASLLGSLNPAAISFAAAMVLGDRPTLVAWAGIFATTAGVGWVMWERAQTPAEEKSLSRGVLYGLMSVACTTGAVLLAKVGVASVAAVQGAWIRLAAGSAGLLLWGAFHPELPRSARSLLKPEVALKAAVVVSVVVFGGFWLSLVALKHLDASIAGPLNSTAPLFILPMSLVMMKERFSAKAAVATAIAVFGVAFILRG